MDCADHLSHVEIRAVADLQAKYTDLPAGLCDALRDQFKSLKMLFRKVADADDDHVFQGQVVLMGMLNRTYELFLGSIQQLVQGNGHVWSACLRGLIETFGAMVYISERPDSLPSFSGRGITAGRLRAAAERGRPGLGKDLSRLNDVVHPGDRSIFAGSTVVDETERQVVFGLGLQDFASDDIQEGATATNNICSLIVQRTEALINSRPGVLRSGKSIGQRHKA